MPKIVEHEVVEIEDSEVLQTARCNEYFKSVGLPLDGQSVSQNDDNNNAFDRCPEVLNDRDIDADDCYLPNVSGMKATIENAPPDSPAKQTQDPFNWIGDFEVSTEEAASYDDPEWVYENLIIQGHMMVLCAEANGGKTTLMMQLSAEMVKSGYDLFYVNADVGQSDAKQMVKFAKDNDFTLLLPDMKAGKSMASVVENLRGLNERGGDFSNKIFIFDTLKKMTDVIVKKQAKELYQLFRSLSAKGMTIICLAHTNKYKDEGGKPIFEGTGDLRTDFDELIYLIPEKNPDGTMTISTEPDKQRGKFEPITFKVDANRTVTRLDEYIDVLSEKQKNNILEKDNPTVERIIEAIKAKNCKQSDIVEYCMNRQISQRTVLAVLKRHDQNNDCGLLPQWREVKGFQHNARFYELTGE